MGYSDNLKNRFIMEEKNVKVGGLDALTLLGLIFVTLKLCSVINWSWWWVLLPFWGGLALVLVIVMIAFIYELFKRS